MENWVTKRARLTPDKVAVTDGETSYTFREVLERACRLCSALDAFGAMSAQNIAMMANNDIRGYLMAVTLMMRGKTVVWLNKRLTDEELLGQMSDTGVETCLCDDNLVQGRLFGGHGIGTSRVSGGHSGSIPRILTFGEVFAEVASGESGAGAIPQDFADNRVLSVMFTSGSTGHPKGIKQTVRNHFTSAVSVALSLGVSPDDEWLCAVPIFHISGYSIILRGLIFGVTVRLMGHFDAHEMDRILREEPVTWVSVVPTMLKPLVALCGGTDVDAAQQSHYNSSFKGFILGGEKSDVAMLKRCAELGMPVVRSYGMTETCSQIVGTGLADSRDTSRLLSVGKPYFTTQLRLAEATGEIEIKTGALTSGYIQDDGDGGGRFAAKLTDDGWYRTGDVGYFDTDGYLYIDGRLDNMLISGGEHVFPEEVERVYADCPGIAEIAVTAESDEVWGQVPVAYVVPTRENASTDAEEFDCDLRAYGRRRLAHYKVPRRFYAVAALPKTSTGKVRRFLLGR